jgi:hypothetical protein
VLTDTEHAAAAARPAAACSRRATSRGKSYTTCARTRGWWWCGLGRAVAWLAMGNGHDRAVRGGAPELAPVASFQLRRCLWSKQREHRKCGFTGSLLVREIELILIVEAYPQTCSITVGEEAPNWTETVHVWFFMWVGRLASFSSYSMVRGIGPEGSGLHEFERRRGAVKPGGDGVNYSGWVKANNGRSSAFTSE